MFNIPPELSMFFQFNDPIYQNGYEDGFNARKEAYIEKLEKLISEIKKETAFVETTSIDNDNLPERLNRLQRKWNGAS